MAQTNHTEKWVSKRIRIRINNITQGIPFFPILSLLTLAGCWWTKCLGHLPTGRPVSWRSPQTTACINGMVNAITYEETYEKAKCSHRVTPYFPTLLPLTVTPCLWQNNWKRFDAARPLSRAVPQLIACINHTTHTVLYKKQERKTRTSQSNYAVLSNMVAVNRHPVLVAKKSRFDAGRALARAGPQTMA